MYFSLFLNIWEYIIHAAPGSGVRAVSVLKFLQAEVLFIKTVRQVPGGDVAEHGNKISSHSNYIIKVGDDGRLSLKACRDSHGN